VPASRTTTVVDYAGAAAAGALARGTLDAGGLPALRELAELAAAGALEVPIAAGFPLAAVRDAYRALAEGRPFGRVVLHPGEGSR
jgi:NADPH:quinone reductase